MLLIRIRNNTCKALSPGVGSYRPVFNVVAIVIDMLTMVGPLGDHVIAPGGPRDFHGRPK